MDGATKYERSNRLTGFTVSLLVHAALLAVCFFLLKLTPPNPPLSDYGLSVNFGVDDAGYGDIQTLEPAGENPAASAESQAAQNPDPADPASVPPADPAPTDKADENVVTGTEEAPHEVKPEEPKEKPAKVKPEPKPEPKPEKKPEKPEKKTEPKPDRKPDVKPEKTPDKSTASDSKASGKPGKSEAAEAGTKGGNNNNGNVKGATGDQGNPNGSLDERNNYSGTPGKGKGGSSLELTGWRWDDKPDVQDNSDEQGRIVFEIKVDAGGEITGVRTLEKTISPALEKVYKRKVEELTFSKTNDNVKPAAESTGKITFIITNR